MERRSSADREPGTLTCAVCSARDRRGLLSGAVARESGVDLETVVRVLANDPVSPRGREAERLGAWAAAATAGGIDLNEPTRSLEPTSSLP